MWTSIEELRPIWNTDVIWSQEKRGIVLRVPWQKAGFAFRHFEVLTLGEVMFTLKPMVGETWLHCDGSRSVKQILQEVKVHHPDASKVTLKRTIDWLIRKGWLVLI